MISKDEIKDWNDMLRLRLEEDEVELEERFILQRTLASFIAKIKIQNVYRKRDILNEMEVGGRIALEIREFIEEIAGGNEDIDIPKCKTVCITVLSSWLRANKVILDLDKN